MTHHPMENMKTKTFVDLSPAQIEACDRIREAIDCRSRSEVIRRSVSVMDRLTQHTGRVLLENETGELAPLIFESV